MSESTNNHLVKKEILGVGITNDTKENILEFLIKFLQNSSKKCYIVTPNPEILVLSTKYNEYREVLNNAEIALNDGVGISLGGMVLGKVFNERFSGTDFVESVCEKCNDWPITVGFLGAGPKVAESVAECLKSKYPRLKVAFAKEEWDQNSSEKCDILFVAFGAPKQEFWMRDNLNKFSVRVMVGVGGAFDYISGKVWRAPELIRVIGLEWFFRLALQPWRLKRQLALLEFVSLILKEKFKK